MSEPTDEMVEAVRRGVEHPDVYLKAADDYLDGFYALAMKHKIPAAEAAEWAKHLRNAVLGLHRLAAASALAWRRLDEFPDKTKWPWDGTPMQLFSPYAETINCAGGLIWNSGGYGRAALNPASWRGESNKNGPTHFRPLPAPPQARPWLPTARGGSSSMYGMSRASASTGW